MGEEPAAQDAAGREARPADAESETWEEPEAEERPDPGTGQADPSPAAELLSLEAAVERIPAALRERMEERLRAQFREVVPWHPEPR